MGKAHMPGFCHGFLLVLATMVCANLDCTIHPMARCWIPVPSRHADNTRIVAPRVLTQYFHHHRMLLRTASRLLHASECRALIQEFEQQRAELRLQEEESGHGGSYTDMTLNNSEALRTMWGTISPRIISVIKASFTAATGSHLTLIAHQLINDPVLEVHTMRADSAERGSGSIHKGPLALPCRPA